MCEPTKLSELLQIRRRLVDPRLTPDERFYYYSMPAFDENREPRISRGGEIDSAKFLVEVGDILVSKLNPRIKRVWKVDTDESLRGISSTEFVDIVPASSTERDFIYHLLSSDVIYRQLQRTAEGTTNSHVRFKPGFLQTITLSELPRRRTWQRIAEILSTVDEAIEQTEALIAKTQQIKAGLMHDLFTRGVTPDGQLRPPREEAPQLYKESALGWIPREWEVVSVDDFCGQVVDCPHSTPTYVSRGIPCIRTADMLPGELLLEEVYRVTEKTYYERVARLVPRFDDIIYSREGERLGIASPVGDEPVCLGQRVMLLRPTPDTNSAFMLWAMNTDWFYRRVVSGLGATTSPHVNVGDIRKQPLPRPSRCEQDLIGIALSSVQTKVQADLAACRKLRATKHGLMSDLLTGRVRVPDVAAFEPKEVAANA